MQKSQSLCRGRVHNCLTVAGESQLMGQGFSERLKGHLPGCWLLHTFKDHHFAIQQHTCSRTFQLSCKSFWITQNLLSKTALTHRGRVCKRVIHFSFTEAGWASSLCHMTLIMLRRHYKQILWNVKVIQYSQAQRMCTSQLPASLRQVAVLIPGF